MLPPLQIERDPPARETLAHAQRSGQRRGACRLHQVAGRLDHRHDRRADLVVGDEHEIVEQVPHDPLRQLEGCARRESLGERLHAILQERALLPRPVGSRRGIGLDADHLDACAHCLGGDARTRRSAPAAHGDDDHVDLRLVFQQLERRGRDAGDQVRLVARVDIAIAVLGRELRAVLARLVEVASVRDDLRSERLHRRELHRIHALGHADDRAHAEEPRGIRDRLAVIAGRGRDHPSGALVAGELSHEVDAATHLERPDRQVVLVLHPHVGVDDVAEGTVGVERRRPQIGRDAPAGAEHICEGRSLEVAHQDEATAFASRVVIRTGSGGIRRRQRRRAAIAWDSGSATSRSPS